MVHLDNFFSRQFFSKFFAVLAFVYFSAGSVVAKNYTENISLAPSCSLEVSVDPQTSSVMGNLVVEFNSKGEYAIQANGTEIQQIDVTPKIKKRKKNYQVEKNYRMSVNFAKNFSSNNANNETGGYKIFLGGNWHPQLIDKEGNAQECVRSLRAKFPPAYLAISHTDDFTKETNDNENWYSFHYDRPFQEVQLYASDSYVIKKETVAFSSTQLQLEVWLLQEHAHLAQIYLQQLKLYARRYFQLFGFFPYKRFALVENSGANSSLPSLFAVSKNNIDSISLAYAFVQQWLGNYVRMSSALGNWATALTYYLTTYTFAQEQDFAKNYRRELLYNYQKNLGKKDEQSVLDFRREKNLSNEFVNESFIDKKAAMIFHLAKLRMGKENFNAAVVDFTKNYGKKSATWQQLVDSFNEYSPGIAASLFWPWLSSRGLIDVEFKGKSLFYHKGSYHITLEMNRLNQTPDTTVSFFADIFSSDKIKPLKFRSNMLADEPAEEFTFTTNVLPQKMTIDPLYNLPRYLSEEENNFLKEQFSQTNFQKQNKNKVSPLQQLSVDGISVEVFKPKVRDVLGTVSFQQVMQEIAGKKIICVGEQHNNLSHHFTQLRVIQELFNAGKKIIIGMEMFPQESQAAIDRYILGNNSEEQFLLESKYYDVWGFPYDLYKPIFDYAKAKRIPIKALNINRNVIHAVAVNGLENLDAATRKKLPAQIDTSNENYKNSLREFFYMAHGQHGKKAEDAPNAEQEKMFERFFQAQISWDETMAEQSVLALKKNSSATLVLIAGSGHLRNGYGIPDRIRRRSGIKPVVLLPEDSPENAKRKNEAILPGDYLYHSQNNVEPVAEKTLGVYFAKNSHGKLTVKKFREFSPLLQAGFEEGDVIEKINDKPVKEFFILKTYLYLQPDEQEMKILITRDGIPMLFYVMPEN